MPFLFERFRQADSSKTRAQSGLGLGLAIVRHLVELHGGRVYATSEGEGKGATFVVQLPTQPTLPMPADHSPVGNQGSLSLLGLSILVVDDDPDNRDRTYASPLPVVYLCCVWGVKHPTHNTNA